MEVTELLHRAHEGDSEALSAVFPIVYAELKSLASRRIRRESDADAIETTALVHEAYLRLAGSRLPDFENRSHFFGIAARIMRQVLVDMARARQTEKRGGGRACSLADIPDLGTQDDKTLLALDDALTRLSVECPLKSRLVELRYFCGLTAEQVAEMSSLPVRTVRNELRLARAWLLNEI